MALARNAAIILIGPHDHHGLPLLAWVVIGRTLWLGCLAVANILSRVDAGFLRNHLRRAYPRLLLGDRANAAAPASLSKAL